VRVVRNDRLNIQEAEALQPAAVVISPGPGTPETAGISLALVTQLAGRIPILGVCLGHQAIGRAFGGRVIRAGALMHGKTCVVEHDGRTIFRGLPSPFRATRYHSLVVDRSSLPPCLEVSAQSPDGEIMGLRHRRYPVEGVQFHPESILTEWGRELLRNFLDLGAGRRGD
jgi:anthranilate synthase component 2